LRDALKEFLPSEIYNRKDKIGFETPESNWMMNSSSWIDKTLSYDIPHIEDYIDRQELSKMITNMRSGKCQYNSVIWRCLCFISWARIFKVELKSN
jgi:asparagine synthase (glutamine-hydrolysing)